MRGKSPLLAILESANGAGSPECHHPVVGQIIGPDEVPDATTAPCGTCGGAHVLVVHEQIVPEAS